MDDADIPHLKELFIWVAFSNTNFCINFSTCLHEIHSRFFNFYATISLIIVNLINRVIKNSDYRIGLIEWWKQTIVGLQRCN